MRKLPLLILSLFTCVAVGQDAKPAADDAAALPSISAKTAGMKHMDGLVAAGLGRARRETLPRDSAPGAGWQERRPALREFAALRRRGRTTSGSIAGRFQRAQVVRFERSGPKVLLVEPNMAFRASSADKDEQLAVTQSFPESVLWGFTVAAEGPGARGADRCDRLLSAR